MRVTAITGALGAVVTGITGQEAATGAVAEEIASALDRYSVLVLHELFIKKPAIKAGQTCHFGTFLDRVSTPQRNLETGA